MIRNARLEIRSAADRLYIRQHKSNRSALIESGLLRRAFRYVFFACCGIGVSGEGLDTFFGTVAEDFAPGLP